MKPGFLNIFLPLLFLPLLQCCQRQQPPQTVNILDFGAVPDDGLCDREAFGRAADFLRTHPGTTLIIEPGVYDISDTQAKRIEYEAISGKYGENVQGTLFRPDAPYVKAIDLSGCRNVTIDGNGARLMLEGWYEVITLQNTSDVTLRGLTIHYRRPPNTVGKVTRSTADHFEMEFDPQRYKFLEEGVITGRVHFYDSQKERLYFGRGARSKQLVGPGKIRIVSTTQPAIGDYCILRHSGHYRPAVMVKNSSNTLIENFRIHSHPGMGIVGHMSENITMRNLQVIPEPGDVISINTDATHFTSCKGTVTIENSKFGGQGDDCTNIHNYYYTVVPGPSPNKAEIRIENADLHAVSLDYPDEGDVLALVDPGNLSVVGDYTVTGVEFSELEWRVLVELDAPLPSDAGNYYLTNMTRRPSVRIHNNTVRSHLARAFLVKSDDVVISGNTIQSSTGTAIMLGAEAGWRESAPVSGALVEDNWIIGCGYEHGAQRNASAVSVDISGIRGEPVPLNRDIIIRNNVVVADNQYAFFINCASGVLIENNNIYGCREVAGSENSLDVTIRSNSLSGTPEL